MKRIGKLMAGLVISLIVLAVIYVGYGLRYTLKAEKVNISMNVIQLVADEKKLTEGAVKRTGEIIEERMKYERMVAQAIDTRMAQMNMEQKLAQMMILTNEHDIIQANMETYQPGGIIFFGVDFKGKSIQQVKQRVATLQSFVKVPLLVGVDEEGGDVSRVAGLTDTGIPVFKGARELYQQGIEKVAEDTRTKMELLKSMGLNLNFAPVADVVADSSSYMYSRSAGGSAAEVSEYVKTVLEVMQEEQVLGCIKHFPGYGNNVNTHNGLAVDDRTLSDYEKRDFIPFRVGMENGASMVMVSHIIMNKVDSEHPASLSPTIHEMLREDFEYDGVIVADDLNMQAILKTMSIEEATAEAFVAGNDMVFSADFAASMKGAMKAVEQGRLSEEQINASVKRILRMKIEYGMILPEEEE